MMPETGAFWGPVPGYSIGELKMPEKDWKTNAKLFRAKVRKGGWQKSTVSLCPGYVQANLVILPAEFALDSQP